MNNEEPKFIWAARRKRVSDLIMPKVYFTYDFVSTYWLELIIGSAIINILRLIYIYLHKIWVKWQTKQNNILLAKRTIKDPIELYHVINKEHGNHNFVS